MVSALSNKLRSHKWSSCVKRPEVSDGQSRKQVPEPKRNTGNDATNLHIDWSLRPSPAHDVSPSVTATEKVNTTGETMINWKALDNVPVLLYILALKTLLLCLAFAGVKIYQSKRAEEALKKQQAEKRRLARRTQELVDNCKED